MIKSWKYSVHSSIALNFETSVNTIPFEDDQAIFQNTEDDLQSVIFKLLCKNYSMKISKTKIIAFKRKEPIRTKIVLRTK